jgi:dUTP pyrophosphatase
MNDVIPVEVMQLAHAEGLPLPAYQTADAAGLDLTAAIADDAPVTLAPGARAVVPTGIAIALPSGTEAQIRPRSGFAARYGITVLNAPATIDADYRGEIGVLLINHGSEPFVVRRGERVAQLVIARVARAQFLPVGELPPTSRGSAGWGSTGRS